MKTSATALAIAALVATAASAQELHQFVGPSDAVLDGGQGMFSYHQACQSTYPGSVWCTDKMLVEGAPAEGVVLDPGARLWVNPVPAGGLNDSGTFIALTHSLMFEQVAADNVLACSRWTDSSNLESGLVIEGTDVAGANGVFVNRVCSNLIPAACCEGVKPPKDK